MALKLILISVRYSYVSLQNEVYVSYDCVWIFELMKVNLRYKIFDLQFTSLKLNLLKYYLTQDNFMAARYHLAAALTIIEQKNKVTIFNDKLFYYKLIFQV